MGRLIRMGREWQWLGVRHQRDQRQETLSECCRSGRPWWDLDEEHTKTPARTTCRKPRGGGNPGNVQRQSRMDSVGAASMAYPEPACGHQSKGNPGNVMRTWYTIPHPHSCCKDGHTPPGVSVQDRWLGCTHSMWLQEYEHEWVKSVLL